MTNRRQTIAVDFDGVVHKYSKGWHDGTCYDEPMEGAFDSICRLRSRGFDVVIFSARPRSGIQDWFQTYWPRDPRYGQIPLIVNEKPIAVAYIDDRAIRFTNWPEAMELVRKFVL